jgi:hypothetical protein
MHTRGLGTLKVQRRRSLTGARTVAISTTNLGPCSPTDDYLFTGGGNCLTHVGTEGCLSTAPDAAAPDAAEVVSPDGSADELGNDSCVTPTEGTACSAAATVCLPNSCCGIYWVCTNGRWAYQPVVLMAGMASLMRLPERATGQVIGQVPADSRGRRSPAAA